jgi:signal recognition particle receptor subunit alpha
MLDAVEVVTTSGIVLWRKHYAPLSPHVINSLINQVFIEERHASSSASSSASPSAYTSSKYTLKYATAKDVGLIFVVGKSHNLSASRAEWRWTAC